MVCMYMLCMHACMHPLHLARGADGSHSGDDDARPRTDEREGGGFRKNIQTRRCVSKDKYYGTTTAK